MILIIEPDKKVRKKLSDLLDRERIIGKSMMTEALEILCRYKQEINLIIADVQILTHNDEHQTVEQICKKLSFKQPPVLGIYATNGSMASREIEEAGKKHRLIGYRVGDPEFPANYLRAVSDLYPGVRTDLDHAVRAWLSDDADDMAELQKWLQEEGFVISEKKADRPMDKAQAKPRTGTGAVQTPASPAVGELLDYKKMYNELKQKYDELLELVHELTKSIVENGEKGTDRIDPGDDRQTS